MTTTENTAFVLKKTDEPFLAKIPERLVQPLRIAHSGDGYEYIAHVLKIPLGTVKSRISRARKRILAMRAAAATLDKFDVDYQEQA